MRIVALLLPFYGHVNPTLRLLQRLVHAGAEVITFGTDRFEAVIRSTGSEFRSYESEDFGPLVNAPHGHGGMALLSHRLLEATRGFLRDDVPAIEELSPDVIMHDVNAPWGRAAVRRLGVPGVSLNPSFAWNRQVWQMASDLRLGYGGIRGFAALTWHAVRTLVAGRRLNLETRSLLDELFLGKQDLNVVFTSRTFQPFSELFDSRFVFAGPALDEWEPEPDFPWDLVGSKKIILVSLGTSFNLDPHPYRVCIEALANMNLPVVVSTGWGLSEDALPCHPNVIVRPFVPQMRLLRQASLFVCHGGIGGLSRAIGCGVPVIAIPGIREQALVAARVEELGAGVVIPRKKLTVASLRQGADRVLDDRTFSENAERVGQSFVSTDGMNEAVEKIFALARTV